MTWKESKGHKTPTQQHVGYRNMAADWRTEAGYSISSLCEPSAQVKYMHVADKRKKITQSCREIYIKKGKSKRHRGMVYDNFLLTDKRGTNDLLVKVIYCIYDMQGNTCYVTWHHCFSFFVFRRAFIIHLRGQECPETNWFRGRGGITLGLSIKSVHGIILTLGIGIVIICL